jgi:hypothetical protein
VFDTAGGWLARAVVAILSEPPHRPGASAMDRDEDLLTTTSMHADPMPRDLVRDLAAIEVLQTDGRPLRLGELWRERTRVVALVRHFG